MHENLYLGLPEVHLIEHGEWADPELEYKGKVVNYYELEDCLYEIFKEENPKIPFEEWVVRNSELVYSFFQED